jgi:hypothetical protein
MARSNYSNQVLAAVYFALSVAITWWFVEISPVYVSRDQMLLSTAIAGGKWLIQILLALIFLKDKKWGFIERIGFVCLKGSCFLLPYIGLNLIAPTRDPRLFIYSLVIAVLAMIYFYFKATRQSKVSVVWWFIWLVFLAIAIMLQLTIVFQIVQLEEITLGALPAKSLWDGLA